MVFRNCKGAKINGLIRHSDPAILRCFHFKHTEKVLLFDYASNRSNTLEDMNNNITPFLGTGVTPLHISLSTRVLKRDLTAILASDVVVVTRAQLAGFFGRTFADRISLMGFKSKGED